MFLAQHRSLIEFSPCPGNDLVFEVLDYGDGGVIRTFRFRAMDE